MKRKQVEVLKYFPGRIYRSDRHKSQLDALLANQRIQAVMEEYERKYDKYIHEWAEKGGGRRHGKLSKKG